jgi:hypothetical protein
VPIETIGGRAQQAMTARNWVEASGAPLAHAGQRRPPGVLGVALPRPPPDPKTTA